MPRVIIHSRDDSVEVEDDGDLETVAAKARVIWDQYFGGPATEERQG